MHQIKHYIKERRFTGRTRYGKRSSEKSTWGREYAEDIDHSITEQFNVWGLSGDPLPEKRKQMTPLEIVSYLDQFVTGQQELRVLGYHSSMKQQEDSEQSHNILS
uniref:Uncharacterized protein n=1 Tax=Ditylenchus dipsaci TaxID=166011 RepID=A0A915EFX0_9BILA